MQFGTPGAGQSIPRPGDYNGDGRTDIAVYLPALGDLAYRPSGGGADVIEQFGTPATGQTVPASSSPYAQPTTSGAAGGVSAAVAVNIPLSGDLPATSLKKKHPRS